MASYPVRCSSHHRPPMADQRDAGNSMPTPMDKFCSVSRESAIPFLPCFILSKLLNAFLLILLFLTGVLLFACGGPFSSSPVPTISLLSGLTSRALATESCDYSLGRWVKDERRRFEFYGENCTFLDPGFRCHHNGRKDDDYLKWKWHPDGCNLPRGWYFQVGEEVDMMMDVKVAFRRAMSTFAKWVLGNLELQRSHIFFRTYAPTHYMQGTWDTGGSCDSFILPEESNYSEVPFEPWNNVFISEAVEEIKKMKRKVQLLNITYLTKFRKDGHPSIHRERISEVAIQDCSHWCLPGVPDTWNELLYAYLLSDGYNTSRNMK